MCKCTAKVQCVDNLLVVVCTHFKTAAVFVKPGSLRDNFTCSHLPRVVSQWASFNCSHWSTLTHTDSHWLTLTHTDPQWPVGLSGLWREKKLAVCWTLSLIGPQNNRTPTGTHDDFVWNFHYWPQLFAKINVACTLLSLFTSHTDKIPTRKTVTHSFNEFVFIYFVPLKH